MPRRTLTGAVVRDEHHAKAGLPGHHLRVGSRRLIQRDGLDHRRHATERAETKRCITGCGVSRQRARYLAPSEYEILASNLDRLGSDTDVNADTAGAKAPESRTDNLATRSRYQNNFSAAEGLQSLSRIGSGTVDVVMSTELLGQFRRIRATSNRHDLEPHVPRVLNTQMPQAAYTEHGDKITSLRWCVSQLR